ncbi:MAG: sensor histidine kinase [Verrucomicrobiaceae bacterium]|nr:sensor histidine kinase [Verrucomicrobiaceae bacterium]
MIIHSETKAFHAPSSRVSLEAALRRMPVWLMAIVLPGLSAAIGWIDYLTGWEWSLFVLYALPIFLAVWWRGRNAGLLLAGWSAVIWWVANQAGNPYQTQLGYNLAMFSRFVYFAFAAIGGAAIRNKQEADAAHIRMLEERRQLEQDLVSVSEHEQQRIGQDLHDGLCQQLAAIGCAARALADDLQARALPEAQDASQIEELIQQAVLEARSLARGIFPVHVDRSGLSTALSELANTTSRLTGVPIEVKEGAEVHLSDPDVSMHLYRIAQEAVANAVRHSGATLIVIALEAHEGILELRIEDNGCGIEASRRSPREGMGLRTMRYRAQALGADLIIKNRVAGGTVVVCQLKVKPDLPEPTFYGPA